MFIAVATAAALYAKVGLKIRLSGFEDILPALRISIASSREQHPLSPRDAQRLSCWRQARSRASTAL